MLAGEDSQQDVAKLPPGERLGEVAGEAGMLRLLAQRLAVGCADGDHRDVANFRVSLDAFR